MWDPVCEAYTSSSKFYEMLCHHQTFNQVCQNNGIFPVGARAYATTAADDELREEIVNIQNWAIMKITAANVCHLKNKENGIEDKD